MPQYTIPRIALATFAASDAGVDVNAFAQDLATQMAGQDEMPTPEPKAAYRDDATDGQKARCDLVYLFYLWELMGHRARPEDEGEDDRLTMVLANYRVNETNCYL